LQLPRLKEVRELHGWSQAKLAEVSDVSRDSISNYETGQREAWPATAKKLADALHVEIADLREPARELATSGKGKAPRGAGQRGQEETAERREWLDNLLKTAQPIMEQDDQTIAAHRQTLARMKGGKGVADSYFAEEESSELTKLAAEALDFLLQKEEERRQEKARQ
jgi:transcriptional regulator with XRE-family HTH domain